MNKEEKVFYIIIGKSGCGKGTQAELLRSYLEKENKKVLYITTGGNFREFIKSDNFTANKSKHLLNTGGLMPNFLAVWNWSQIFINKIVGDENIILDGAPRKEEELTYLFSAVEFYDFKKVIMIHLDVTDGWAVKRLIERGRGDDNEKEEQERKMAWFKTDTMSVIENFKKRGDEKEEGYIATTNVNNDIRFIYKKINGEQSVENVSVEIMSQIR